MYPMTTTGKSRLAETRLLLRRRKPQRQARNHTEMK